MKFIKKLVRNEEGATAIEYGLIAALIAVAAISAMQGLGEQLEIDLQHHVVDDGRAGSGVILR